MKTEERSPPSSRTLRSGRLPERTASAASWLEARGGDGDGLPLWVEGGSTLEAARATAFREESAAALASEGGASSVGLCRAALGWGCVSGCFLFVAASCVALDAGISAIGGEALVYFSSCQGRLVLRHTPLLVLLSLYLFCLIIRLPLGSDGERALTTGGTGRRLADTCTETEAPSPVYGHLGGGGSLNVQLFGWHFIFSFIFWGFTRQCSDFAHTADWRRVSIHSSPANISRNLPSALIFPLGNCDLRDRPVVRGVASSWAFTEIFACGATAFLTIRKFGLSPYRLWSYAALPLSSRCFTRLRGLPLLIVILQALLCLQATLSVSAAWIFGSCSPKQCVAALLWASGALWICTVLSHVLQIDAISPPFQPKLALHTMWASVCLSMIWGCGFAFYVSVYGMRLWRYCVAHAVAWIAFSVVAIFRKKQAFPLDPVEDDGAPACIHRGVGLFRGDCMHARHLRRRELRCAVVRTEGSSPSLLSESASASSFGASVTFQTAANSGGTRSRPLRVGERTRATRSRVSASPSDSWNALNALAASSPEAVAGDTRWQNRNKSAN